MNDGVTISVRQLFELFPDQESARKYIELRLWPEGPVCPRCGGMDRIGVRKGGYYRCNPCKWDFTVRTGTAFGRSHIPLDRWIHAMYLLDLMPAAPQLKEYLNRYRAYDYPHPVFELAFRWLEERTPDTPEPTLVHGDYRHGNFVIGPEGIRAVLDWEIAHRGDPMEDLGWMCVNSWRYGAIDKPVGGFGEREDLFAGYEAGGGGTVDPKRVKYWELFGSLRWGIMCMGFYDGFINGPDRSVERAAIPRRCSETEIDLLRLLREEF